MGTAQESYDRGFDHFAKREFDKAIEEFGKSLEIDPKFALAQSALAMAYAEQGDLDRAIEEAKKAIALAPEDPLAHTDLSRYYQRKGMIPEAEVEMAKANALQRPSG